MSLISRLLHAVQSWRRRPGGPQATKRAAVSMELLEDRQLLAVNFTGNVAIDFPATQQPGVAVLTTNSPSKTAGLPPNLANIIGVSGFSLSEIRVSYSASDDVLSIGLNQPSKDTGLVPPGSPLSPFSVIAGDADNNGDDGTVSAAVRAIKPTPNDFDDPANFGKSETMGAFLDLNQDGYADIVAGYAFNDPRMPKQYQVAQAIVNTNAPPTRPGFGTALPENTGNVYKVNSPVHPNLEFAINNFSKLYLQETGQELTPDKVISFGAFAGSGDDDGVGESFFPQVPVSFDRVIVPPPPVCPPCPPVSPPVLVNPHQNNHINTAHPTDIRVSILGTSGFNVQDIDPSTVRLGGAAPVYNFVRRVNNDQFLDQTFIFKGTDVQLPPGITNATVTGSLTNGQTFETSVRVFNRDFSFYPPSEVAQAQGRQAANPNRLETPISAIQRKLGRSGGGAIAAAAVHAPKPSVGVQIPRGPAAMQVRSARGPQALTAAAPQVISIQKRQAPSAGKAQRASLSSRLESSLNDFADSHASMLSDSLAQSSR